eukprot:1139488-Pelagomonas_calceolata.AAC.1
MNGVQTSLDPTLPPEEREGRPPGLLLPGLATAGASGGVEGTASGNKGLNSGNKVSGWCFWVQRAREWEAGASGGVEGLDSGNKRAREWVAGASGRVEGLDSGNK